jgi:hypothetical protein
MFGAFAINVVTFLEDRTIKRGRLSGISRIATAPKVLRVPYEDDKSADARAPGKIVISVTYIILMLTNFKEPGLSPIE